MALNLISKDTKCNKGDRMIAIPVECEDENNFTSKEFKMPNISHFIELSKQKY